MIPLIKTLGIIGQQHDTAIDSFSSLKQGLGRSHRSGLVPACYFFFFETIVRRIDQHCLISMSQNYTQNARPERRVATNQMEAYRSTRTEKAAPQT